MRAIYRHELSTHLCGLTGCVFGAFLLVFTGLFTVYYNISGAMAQFEVALADPYMALVFVFAIPILTMRVIAEERKQKTDQLLYSLPLSMTQVVLGKYLALLTVMAVPVVVMIFYPTLLSAYGPLHMPTALGSICGFFLLGAALLSMGLFVSSLTESQAVSAGLCFVVMLFNYFVADLASLVGPTTFASYAAYAAVLLLGAWLLYRLTRSQLLTGVVALVTQIGLAIYYNQHTADFAGSFSDLVSRLSVFERFYDFVMGIFDLKSIVYLLSICVLFVHLTIQTMEKRRWSE